MKPFYSPAVAAPAGPAAGLAATPEGSRLAEAIPAASAPICTRARIAVYDVMSAAPRIFDVEPGPLGEFIEELAARIHELCRAEGSFVPYAVIREVAENFIHANFAEPVISILDAGTTIRFADRGPGIADKERAVLPGFTTACGEMKCHIRGVGSGLPIVRDYLSHSGGSLAIEDNLGGGSVVTVYAGPRHRAGAETPSGEPAAVLIRRASPSPAGQSSFPVGDSERQPVARPRLSARQKHVLALVLESGLVGPSLVSKELGVGISTAYRDLAMLEEAGLIVSDGGKRTLTAEGLTYLGDLMNRS